MEKTDSCVTLQWTAGTNTHHCPRHIQRSRFHFDVYLPSTLRNAGHMFWAKLGFLKIF